MSLLPPEPDLSGSHEPEPGALLACGFCGQPDVQHPALPERLRDARIAATSPAILRCWREQAIDAKRRDAAKRIEAALDAPATPITLPSADTTGGSPSPAAAEGGSSTFEPPIDRGEQLTLTPPDVPVAPAGAAKAGLEEAPPPVSLTPTVGEMSAPAGEWASEPACCKCGAPADYSVDDEGEWYCEQCCPPVLLADDVSDDLEAERLCDVCSEPEIPGAGLCREHLDAHLAMVHRQPELPTTVAKVEPPVTILRCSSLPLYHLCRGSVLGEGVRVDPHNDLAEIGTAVHDAIAEAIRSGQRPDVEDDGRSDTDDVRILAFRGWRAYQALKDWIGDEIEIEQHREEVLPGGGAILSGHVDCSGRVGRWAHAADWKTGYRQDDCLEQLKGYAWLRLQREPSLIGARVRPVWVRYGVSPQPVEFTRAGLDEWARHLGNSAQHWHKQYRPGEHCSRCSLRSDCPAHHADARAAVAVLGDPSWLEEMRAGLASLPDDRVIELRRRASQLGKVAEVVKGMIGDLVRERGEIMHSDGSRLVACEETRSALDVPLAWPILAARLPREALIGAIKLGKGDIKKAAGREWKQIEVELAEAGALRETTYTKVMEARA